MILATAAFGSQKTVEAFGYNIYIVETEGVESAPKGCAVMVRKCRIQDLKKDNLILWENDEQPALGYIREIMLSDGVYSLKLNENSREHIILESQIIGHAEFSSAFLGQVISFIKTPFGVFCIAVLPCITLILYDIIRAFAKNNQSEPEVEPQFKNTGIPVKHQQSVQNSTIGVNDDGKASLNRSKTADAAAANRILFELESRQQKKSVQSKKTNSGTILSDFARPEKTKSSAVPKDYPKSPKTTVIGAYSKISQNTENSDSRIATPAKDRTTELASISKRSSSEAFFAQTSATGRQNRSAPQIGKPAGESKSETASESINKSASKAVSGRKSSQILASKSIDDLISDDDYRDKPRTSKDIVDDILADIKKNDNV